MKSSLLIAVFAMFACSPARDPEPVRTARRPPVLAAPATAPDPEASAAPSGAPSGLPGNPAIPDSSPTAPRSADAGSPASAASPRGKTAIRYIGMHIGGGPNDSATKAPFEKALQSSFGALQECCGSAGCTSGTLGVDLLVPKEGGRAEISNPRANLPDATLRCILAALGQVQFAPPRHGATKLSYSVRLSAPAP